MRTIIAIALASIGIAGCASNEPDPIGRAVLELLTLTPQPGGVVALFYPHKASESDMSRITELAWPNYQQGVSMKDACSDARSQLRIKSQAEFLDVANCTQILKEKAREQEIQAGLAKMEAKRQAYENRLAMIRANQAEIETESEAADIYGAEDVRYLMQRPSAQPDNRRYLLYGVLDAGDGLQRNSLLIRNTYDGRLWYAHVQIGNTRGQRPTKAHVETWVFIVGDYVSTMQYKNNGGAIHTMPVFKAVFVKFPG